MQSDISMFARNDNRSIFGQLSKQIDEKDERQPTIEDQNILHIKQKRSTISTGIPLLHSLYSNRGMEKDALIKYQLIYYQFPTEEELDVGDGYIDLAIENRYLRIQDVDGDATLGSLNSLLAGNYEFHSNFTLDSGDIPYTTIKVPTAVGRTVNAEEMARHIHMQLHARALQTRDKVIAMEDDDTGMTITEKNQLVDLANFFMFYQEFVFDSTMQKFAVKLHEPDIGFLGTVGFNTSNEPMYGFVSDLHLQLRTSNATSVDQKNIARAMGCNTDDTVTYTKDSATYTGYVGNFRHEWEVGRSYDSIILAHLRNKMATYEDYHQLSGLKPLDQVVTFYRRPQNKLLLIGDMVPRIYSTDFVYIRTNAAAPGWDITNDRAKSDILAIVPRTSGYGTMQPLDNTYFQTTMFSVIDTLNSMKTLQLRVTDEDGNQINFHRNFRLGIMVLPCEGKPGDSYDSSNKKNNKAKSSNGYQ